MLVVILDPISVEKRPVLVVMVLSKMVDATSVDDDDTTVPYKLLPINVLNRIVVAVKLFRIVPRFAKTVVANDMVIYKLIEKQVYW